MLSIAQLTPNDPVQTFWNDLQLSFFAFFAPLIFWVFETWSVQKRIILKNEAPSLQLCLCKNS